MAIEIERKFLVTGDDWRETVTSEVLLRQGYLSSGGSLVTVRVRCLPNRAFLTIKAPRNGIARAEFEYEIPLAHGEEMLQTLCANRRLEKKRHTIEAGGLTWHVDEFQGAHFGLLLAEVELSDVDQRFSLPSWVGEEVTGRREYQNAVLAERRHGRRSRSALF